MPAFSKNCTPMRAGPPKARNLDLGLLVVKPARERVFWCFSKNACVTRCGRRESFKKPQESPKSAPRESQERPQENPRTSEEAHRKHRKQARKHQKNVQERPRTTIRILPGPNLPTKTAQVAPKSAPGGGAQHPPEALRPKSHQNRPQSG